MEPTATMPAALTAAPATYAEAAKSEEAAISSDFETFLVMLTAQLENQDPLNPVDSADYAVQLATFSGVEQQVRTNDLLKDLTGQMGLMGLSDIAGWVGMEANVEAPVYFDQSPVTLTPKPASGADEMWLVARDSNDEIVEKTLMTASDDAIDWAGVDDDGAPLPAGTYSFELISLSNGEVLSTDPVSAYNRIVETQNDDGKLWLVLESGERVAADGVSAIREAGL